MSSIFGDGPRKPIDGYAEPKKADTSPDPFDVWYSRQAEGYRIFFVKVPDEWTLPVNKVYVLAYFPKHLEFADYFAIIRAFDEDFAVTHLGKTFKDIRTILRNAPEFDVHSEFRDVLPTSIDQDDKFKEASVIPFALGQSIEQISLVAIKFDGTWSGKGFFYSLINGRNENNSPAFIAAKQALRRKLKGETPMFARGALYQWALLSVAGILDSQDPTKILRGKSFSLIDAWRGRLKLNDHNIEELESLATDDDSRAAVAKMKMERYAPIDYEYFDIENTAEYNPDLPMTKVIDYLVTTYKLAMVGKLDMALKKGRVKKIGDRIFNKDKVFSSPTIYDCYQEIDPVKSNKTRKYYATGPLYVGSSFNDRTLKK